MGRPAFFFMKPYPTGSSDAGRKGALPFVETPLLQK